MTEVAETVPALSREEIEYRLLERQALGLSKARGGMVPRAYQGNPGDILAAFLMARTYNIDAFAMMRGTYFVNGKPTMSGDLMLAIAYANGCKVVETGGENEQIGMFASCSVWRAVDPTTSRRPWLSAFSITSETIRLLSESVPVTSQGPVFPIPRESPHVVSRLWGN